MIDEDNFWVEESSGNLPVCIKRKRRVSKRKLEFVGWGSTPLIEFLEAIGQDTSKEHSRHDVAAFITKYIKENNLACAEKKKKILCDGRLYALFGKKTISRIKVFEMLEEHFAENLDDSDSESIDTSDEENYRQTSMKNFTQMKKVPKTPRSCFAAIVPENIKMIHLKKSLIEELLKAPECFESKIMGSFVRIKSDPNDIYQKNRFQLQQVTGVEKIRSSGDASNDICLKVSNFFKDITISDLSDDNFIEEEIVDLCDRIKGGMLKRLTVSEVELKAKMLHADITKHWIVREIALLQKLIDRANEKGWRRELFEHLERRKKLQTTSEQEKLLQNVPEVIAEEIEPENVVATGLEKAESDSPPSIVKDSSDVSIIVVPERRKRLQTPYEREKLLQKIPEGIVEEAEPRDIVAAGLEEAGSDCPPNSIVQSSSNVSIPVFPEAEDTAAPVQHYSDAQEIQKGDANGFLPVEDSDEHQDALETPEQVKEMGSHEGDMGDEHADLILQENTTPSGSNGPKLHTLFPYPQEKPAQPFIDLSDEPMVQTLSLFPKPMIGQVLGNKTHNHTVELRAQPMHPELAERMNPTKSAGQTVADGKIPSQVIELSDDESAEDEPICNEGNTGINPYEAIWYYSDPQGQTQGPFALNLLKRWNDANYFPPGFMIWRNGKANSYDAILLADAIRQTFSFPAFPLYPFHPF